MSADAHGNARIVHRAIERTVDAGSRSVATCIRSGPAGTASRHGHVDEWSTTMAEDGMMTAADVVAQVMGGERGDWLRDAVALVAQQLMEAEIEQCTGAGRGERSAVA